MTSQHAQQVNSPAHYNHGQIEVIDVIEKWQLGFCVGNAVKYLARAGRKRGATMSVDLAKARWYLARALGHSRLNERPPLAGDPSCAEVVADWGLEGVQAAALEAIARGALGVAWSELDGWLRECQA